MLYLYDMYVIICQFNYIDTYFIHCVILSFFLVMNMTSLIEITLFIEKITIP